LWLLLICPEDYWIGERMVETEVNVSSVNVQLPSGGDFTFIDSIKGIIDSIVNTFRDADTYALTGLFMGVMLALMVTLLWRMV
jgi:surfactin synthase thioesterase subunit